MAEVGTKLGRYTLHERINAGGMSEIWLATNEVGQSVAVRLMLNNSLLAFTERKRFLTGAEVLEHLPPHPCVIGYVEHG